MSAPRCIGFGGAHVYEARYDESPPTLQVTEMTGNVKALADVVRLYRSVTYVRDVCTRCGHVIERQK